MVNDRIKALTIRTPGGCRAFYFLNQNMRYVIESHNSFPTTAGRALTLVPVPVEYLNFMPNIGEQL